MSDFLGESVSQQLNRRPREQVYYSALRYYSDIFEIMRTQVSSIFMQQVDWSVRDMIEEQLIEDLA